MARLISIIVLLTLFNFSLFAQSSSGGGSGSGGPDTIGKDGRWLVDLSGKDTGLVIADPTNVWNVDTNNGNDQYIMTWNRNDQPTMTWNGDDSNSGLAQAAAISSYQQLDGTIKYLNNTDKSNEALLADFIKAAKSGVIDNVETESGDIIVLEAVKLPLLLPSKYFK